MYVTIHIFDDIVYRQSTKERLQFSSLSKKWPCYSLELFHGLVWLEMYLKFGRKISGRNIFKHWSWQKMRLTYVLHVLWRPDRKYHRQNIYKTTYHLTPFWLIFTAPIWAGSSEMKYYVIMCFHVPIALAALKFWSESIGGNSVSICAIWKMLPLLLLMASDLNLRSTNVIGPKNQSYMVHLGTFLHTKYESI